MDITRILRIGLIGASGSGKTTFLAALLKLLLSEETGSPTHPGGSFVDPEIERRLRVRTVACLY